jgi:hypothetical protein
MILDRLIQQTLHYHFEYRDYLANHLPMALAALGSLGASDNQLQQYFDYYAPRLEPARPASVSISHENWREHVGNRNHFAAYLDFFTNEIATRGRETGLRAWLPKLLPGIGAAAFHGLIRLAYGVERLSATETAAGLAYIASGFLRLQSREHVAPSCANVNEALGHLSSSGELTRLSFVERGISTLMRHSAEHGEFVRLLALPPAGTRQERNRSLTEMAAVAIQLYWQTENFTVLHMVTATHAFRVVLPYIDQLHEAEALSHMWVAFCAAYVSVGAPLLDPSHRGNGSLRAAPQWEDVIALTLHARDEHVIKMVYSCREEFQAYGNPLYQYAAARLAEKGES